MYCAFFGSECGNLIHFVVCTSNRSAAVMSVCVTLRITGEGLLWSTYRLSWRAIRYDVMANWAVDAGSKVGNTSGANIASVTKQHLLAAGKTNSPVHSCHFIYSGLRLEAENCDKPWALPFVTAWETLRVCPHCGVAVLLSGRDMLDLPAAN